MNMQTQPGLAGFCLQIEDRTEIILFSGCLKKVSFYKEEEEIENRFGTSVKEQKFYIELCYNSPLGIEDDQPIYSEVVEVDELGYDSYLYYFFNVLGIVDPIEEYALNNNKEDIRAAA